MKRSVLLLGLYLSLTSLTFSQGIDNENIKITHGPWIQNLSESGVSIMWVTNKPAVPAVILVTGDGKERLVMNSTDGIIDGGGTLHKVKVGGLQSGTSYKYKTVSREISRYQPYKVYYGDTLTKGDFTFRTLEPSQGKVHAVVLNDIHEKHFLIEDFIEETALEHNDLVFMNGDIINHLQDAKQIYDGFLDASVAMFASEIPFFMVRGNHETRGMLARDFKKWFDFPENSFYYGVSQGPVHFIVLDCGEDKPDDNRYYFGMADYDNYRLEQLEWLKKHIETREFREAKYRVVVIHMPVIKGKDMWHGMQFLSDHFGPVLEQAGIDILLAGHTHRVKYYSDRESGFAYPVMVSSNKTFIELFATQKELRVVLRDAKGETLMEQRF